MALASGSSGAPLRCGADTLGGDAVDHRLRFISAGGGFLVARAIAFFTSFIALRAVVRRLMLWRAARLPGARLRADLMFAMCLFQLRKRREF